MDLGQAWTNQNNISDLLDFVFDIKHLIPEKLQDLYINEDKSPRQIADEYGVSKTYVSKLLKLNGINKESKRRLTNPENFRHHNPPFGFRVKNGKLKQYRPEMKTCIKILKLKNDAGLSFRAIAEKLTKDRVINRQGTFNWHHYNVGSIYRRWNEIIEQQKSK